jgi:hypothetical protein
VLVTETANGIRPATFRKRSFKMAVAAATPGDPGPRPLWVPEGVKFDALPRGLQLAISEFINPLYREQVLEAPSELEKAVGLSLVYAAWIEAIQQFELAKAMVGMLPRGGSARIHKESIAEHLRVAGTKERLTKTLLQVKVFQEKRASRVDPLRLE